jgi:hypothetical protein
MRTKIGRYLVESESDACPIGRLSFARVGAYLMAKICEMFVVLSFCFFVLLKNIDWKKSLTVKRRS